MTRLTRHFSNRNAWLATSLLVAALVTAGYFWLTRQESQAKYTTGTVQKGHIEQLVTATGVLQPRNYVDVGAQVSGQLHRLHVAVGDAVKTGDLLAEIDTTVYAARVDATRAQLRNQQAQLTDREAQLALAQINHNRAVNLRRADANTEEEVQRTQAALKSAEAQLNALKAQLQQTESSLRVEEANLEFARIYAPMDGTVVSIAARQGQTLNATQTTPLLMRIADLSTMTVQAQVSEADIGKLQPGMPVYFTILGGEGQRWYSALQRIEPTPEVVNNVVLYNALFEVPNPQGRLMTQMTTQVFFIAAQARDVLTVPAAALTLASRPASDGNRSGERAARTDTDASAQRPAQGSDSASRPERPVSAEAPQRGRPAFRAESTAARSATVRVLKPGGHIEEREVQVGVSNRVRAEILSGLTEGEQVIVGDTQAAPLTQNNNRPWGGGMGMMR